MCLYGTCVHASHPSITPMHTEHTHANTTVCECEQCGHNNPHIYLWSVTAATRAHVCACMCSSCERLKKPTGYMFECATKHVRTNTHKHIHVRTHMKHEVCAWWKLSELRVIRLLLAFTRSTNCGLLSGSNDICTFNRIWMQDPNCPRNYRSSLWIEHSIIRTLCASNGWIQYVQNDYRRIVFYHKKCNIRYCNMWINFMSTWKQFHRTFPT